MCSCRQALLGHFEIGAFHSDTDPTKLEQEILEIHWAEDIIYLIYTLIAFMICYFYIVRSGNAEYE